MTNIAMENPNHKWKFLAGKIIYFYGPSIPWQTVSHNQMVLKKWISWGFANKASQEMSGKTKPPGNASQSWWNCYNWMTVP